MDSKNYDKYTNYKKMYIPNDMFWGIGIENETYIEMSRQHTIDN
jgi:hypothetical protein